MSDHLEESSKGYINELDLSLKINMQAEEGDTRALHLQNLEQQIKDTANKLNATLESNAISLNGYISGVSEYTEALGADLKKLEGEYAIAKNTFEGGFDSDILNKSLKELKEFRLDTIIKETKGLIELTREESDALDALVANREGLAVVLEKQALAQEEVAKTAMAAADAVGLLAASKITNLTIDIRELQTELKAVNAAIKATDASTEVDPKLKTKQALITSEILGLEEEISDVIGTNQVKSVQKVLSGLSSQKLEAALITKETLNTLDANKKNNRTLQQIAAEAAAGLEEQIKKRSILKILLADFDDKTKDVIDTANRMDGAYDNINKTIRSMHKSMADFGKSIDEIVRKRILSEGQAKFDLGIDKELETRIDKINDKYDKLIEKAKARQIGPVTSFRGSDLSVEELEKQRKAAIEAADTKAESVKLAKEQQLAEQEVTRSIKEQKDAQENLKAIIATIAQSKDAGEFEGVEGIQKYQEAMLGLNAAQKEVNQTSDTTRSTLKDLARVEGMNPSAITKYKKELETLDGVGIKLTSQQITMNKTLADGTKELVSGERSNISKPYQELNASINAAVKNNRALIAITDSLTKEFDKVAKTSTTFTGTLADQVNEFNKLEAANAKYNGELANTQKSTLDLLELYNSLNGADLSEGFKARQLDIDVKPSPKISPEQFSAQLNAILGTGEDAVTVNTDVAVRSVKLADGSNDLEFTNVSVTPNSAELQNSTEIIIAGKTYTILGEKKALRDSVEDALRAKFDIKVDAQVSATGIGGQATGGSISGPGSGTSDSILSWLSNGEYVIRASSVAKFGTNFFDMLNNGALPKFASGGLARSVSSRSAVAATRDSMDLNFNMGGETYTLHGERQQAKSIINMFKSMDRG